MATEYISREAALSMPWANGRYDHEHANEHFICGLETYKEWLEQIPAADVRPVVHRSWIVDDYGDYQLIECDQCHAQMWNHQSELPNYCYECGADMRKVVEIDQVKEDDT